MRKIKQNTFSRRWLNTKKKIILKKENRKYVSVVYETVWLSMCVVTKRDGEEKRARERITSISSRHAQLMVEVKCWPKVFIWKLCSLNPTSEFLSLDVVQNEIRSSS